MNNATHLRFERTEKRFGSTLAVAPLDLPVTQGEFVVLIGPSGCGKTTSLRMLAGFEPPTSGRILLGNRDITGLAPKDRNMAMVFQNYALYPHMTAAQNMGFALRLRGMARAEIDVRVNRVAEMLGLSALLGRRPRALSGGQRQRVAVGRAIVRDPEVFLFDEPLSNLDAQMRASARTEIRSLQRSLGVTTVYVTHDQVEAMTMADRIAVMHQGVLLQYAAPLEVYERPADTFVASFLGSPAMNLMSAQSVLSAAHAPAGLFQTLSTAHTLGIRPEHLHLVGAHSGPQDGIRLPATLERVENLGAETLLFARIAQGDVIIARIAGTQSLPAGLPVELFASVRHIVAFGKDQRRLTLEHQKMTWTAPQGATKNQTEQYALLA